MPRHSPYALVRLNFLHRSFDLCCSFLLNCLSFFVHIFSVCSKKALAFSPLFFRLVCRGSLRVPLVEIVFYPTFLERPIFLNIMSSISVRFYSFTFIRFSMNMIYVSLSLTGGDDGNRTHDPLLAGQVLSQLSYTPILGRSTDLSVTEN